MTSPDHTPNTAHSTSGDAHHSAAYCDGYDTAGRGEPCPPGASAAFFEGYDTATFMAEPSANADERTT